MDNETLGALIRDLQQAQTQFADRMQQIALVMQRLTDRLERHEKSSEALLHQIERLDRAVFGVDSEKPGMSLRLDRIEQRYLRTQRVQNWILSGGIVAFISGLVMLWQALKTLSESGVLK